MGKIDRKSIKVLWVSLVKFPPLCEHLGETIPAHCGWMYSSAKALLRMMPEVRLGVMVYSYGRCYILPYSYGKDRPNVEETNRDLPQGDT